MTDRIWTPVPGFFEADTLHVLREPHRDWYIARGNPWIDSPIFDALAAERFGA